MSIFSGNETHIITLDDEAKAAMVLMAAVVLPLPQGAWMTLSLPRTKEDVSSTSDRYFEFFISGYSPGS